MVRCQVDDTLERVVLDGVRFPLGVYPVEAMTPRQGYAVEFEPADNGDGGEWEEWPDRYVFEAVVSAERLRPLCRSLFSLLPSRVYPILDVIGHDAYREIDPYIAYDLVGLDAFLDGTQRYGEYLFEDGMCGFGAMCDDPFVYIFVDEHKIVTVRVLPHDRERAERIFRAFDLAQIAEPAGADAASHEHRPVLLAPEDRPELLCAEEVVEQLRDQWRLSLNIDPEANEDDEGRELGVTRWRCLVRVFLGGQDHPGYIEVLLHASCYRRAEELSLEAAAGALGERAGELSDIQLLAASRLSEEQERAFLEHLGAAGSNLPAPPATPVEGRIILVRPLGEPG